jgi:hypothetical protein
MKKSILLLAVFFLIPVCFSVQSLNAQEKTVTEKENEQKLQQAIDLQKKAMAKQKEAEVKAKEAEAKADDAVVTAGDAVIELQRNNDGMNFYRSRNRGAGATVFGSDEFSNGFAFSNFYGRGGDQERTTWDFSKQVKETTFSRDYSFDVEASSNTVVMTVMGDCKAGSIRVKILMPNGKVYSDIVIDEFGNLNWRKSFTISEDENKDKAGEWKFKIDAEKATGFFKISLQTY